jgi:hypothetical protein
MTWIDFLKMLGIAIAIYYTVVCAYIFIVKKGENKKTTLKTKEKIVEKNKNSNNKNYINKKSVRAEDIILLDTGTSIFYPDDSAVTNQNSNESLIAEPTQENFIGQYNGDVAHQVPLSSDIKVTEYGMVDVAVKDEANNLSNTVADKNLDTIINNSGELFKDFSNQSNLPVDNNTLTANNNLNEENNINVENKAEDINNAVVTNTNIEINKNDVPIIEMQHHKQEKQQPKMDSLLHLIKTKTT